MVLCVCVCVYHVRIGEAGQKIRRLHVAGHSSSSVVVNELSKAVGDCEDPSPAADEAGWRHRLSRANDYYPRHTHTYTHIVCPPQRSISRESTFIRRRRPSPPIYNSRSFISIPEACLCARVCVHRSACSWNCRTCWTATTFHPEISTLEIIDGERRSHLKKISPLLDRVFFFIFFYFCDLPLSEVDPILQRIIVRRHYQ